MDVLSDVLGWLRVEGTLSRRSEYSSPWGISFPAWGMFALLTIESGDCVLVPQGGEPVALEQGDLVMFSPGHAASMADHESTPTVPFAQVRQQSAVDEPQGPALKQTEFPPIRYGGGGRRTVMRGWGLRFDSYEQHPLLSLLPPYIHITRDRLTALPWLDTTLRFIRHETRREDDGSQMMIVRLIDLLFVQVIRAWFEEQPPGEAGWLGALRDSSIRHALKLLHQHPAEPWTVESLGRRVGMSRSSFSSRFGSLVGTSPMKYLIQLRMNLAANALRGDARLSVAEAASQVGYDTESSFGRAFKRHFGVSPAAFRRQRQTGTTASTTVAPRPA